MQNHLPVVDVDPRDPDFYQDPYKHYALWHTHHSRFYWSAYKLTCFSSFSDVDRLLRDRRFGRVRPDSLGGGGCPVGREHLSHFDALEEHSLLNLEPPRHTALRKLVNRAFVSSRVEHLRPQIAAIADELINSLEGRERFDLLKDFLMPLPAIVIARLLGVPDQNVPALLDYSHAIVKVYTLTQSREDEITADEASRDFADLLQQLILERRANPREDLLGHLLLAEIDGQRLSDAEIISSVVLLLNAGHEATVHQTGNAVKALLQHKLDPATVFADEQSSANFVEELLRFDAPLHLFMRYALETVDMGEGLVIEAGEEVALLLGAANRDPLRFAEPDRLWPGRSDAGHVSFGAGIHFCLGAPLARLEMQISLPLLFRRLPQMALADSAQYADSFHFHGLKSLWVDCH